MGLRVVMGNSAPAILANHDRDRHASAMVWCLAAAATRRGRMALGERTRISGVPRKRCAAKPARGRWCSQADVSPRGKDRRKSIRKLLVSGSTTGFAERQCNTDTLLRRGTADEVAWKPPRCHGAVQNINSNRLMMAAISRRCSLPFWGKMPNRHLPPAVRLPTTLALPACVSAL